jgi:hypothetical protein
MLNGLDKSRPHLYDSHGKTNKRIHKGTVMLFWLSCNVSAGIFPNEFAVVGKESDGTPFELFVPEERPGQFVKAPPNGEGPGKVLVELVDSMGTNARVLLPQYRLVGGQYATVPRNTLSLAHPPNVPRPLAAS